MLEFAGILLGLMIVAEIRWGLLAFAEIFCFFCFLLCLFFFFLEFAGELGFPGIAVIYWYYWGLLGLVGICLDLLGFMVAAGIYSSLLGCTLIFWDRLQCAGIYPDLPTTLNSFYVDLADGFTFHLLLQ